MSKKDRWTVRAVVVVAVAFVLALFNAAPAAAHYQPLHEEGLIEMTKRVCGSSATWQEQAARNGLTAATDYWLIFGKWYDIQCSRAVPQQQQTRPQQSAPQTVTSAGSWAHPLPGTCRPSWGGGEYLAPRNGYLHQGIDLGGIEGYRVGTPVRAIGAGKVVYMGYSRKAGNQVQIDHGNGIKSKYNHLSGFSTSYDAWVGAGQTIGGMGGTGNATGPHLHLEIWVNGSHVNGGDFLGARGVQINC